MRLHSAPCEMLHVSDTGKAFIALPRHSPFLIPLWNDWPEIDVELCESNMSYRRSRRNCLMYRSSRRRRRAVRDCHCFYSLFESSSRERSAFKLEHRGSLAKVSPNRRGALISRSAALRKPPFFRLPSSL